MAPAEILALLAADTRRLLVFELAGVFWLFAEAILLLFVLATRRHLNTTPRSPRLRITPQDSARIALVTGGSLLLAAWILYRYTVGIPASVYSAFPTPLTSAHENLLLRVCLQQAQVHHVVWVLFCTSWVVLETAIVYHGYAAFRTLRQLLDNGIGGKRSLFPVAGVLLFGLTGTIALFSLAAQAAVPVPQGIHPVNFPSWYARMLLADAPYQNAVYIYLRLAGVVWITVEWFAAWVLLRLCALFCRSMVPGEINHV